MYWQTAVLMMSPQCMSTTSLLIHAVWRSKFFLRFFCLFPRVIPSYAVNFLWNGLVNQLIEKLYSLETILNDLVFHSFNFVICLCMSTSLTMWKMSNPSFEWSINQCLAPHLCMSDIDIALILYTVYLISRCCRSQILVGMLNCWAQKLIVWTLYKMVFPSVRGKSNYGGCKIKQFRRIMLTVQQNLAWINYRCIRYGTENDYKG